MRFKFLFKQRVDGIESCEAVIEADSEEEAIDMFNNRLFRTYLIMKQDFNRELDPNEQPEYYLVEQPTTAA